VKGAELSLDPLPGSVLEIALGLSSHFYFRAMSTSFSASPFAAEYTRALALAALALAGFELAVVLVIADAMGANVRMADTHNTAHATKTTSWTRVVLGVSA
jgi:hypothetical protein